MKTFFIKPAFSLIVRDPVTAEPLVEAGQKKFISSYWLRRLKDGDVVIADEPAVKYEKKTKNGDDK